MEPTIYKPSIYKGAGIYKSGGNGGGGGGGDTPIPDPDYKRLKFISTNKEDSSPNCSLSLLCDFDDTIEFNCFIHTNVGGQWKYFFHNSSLSFSLKLEGANSRLYGRWNDGGFIETDTFFQKGEIICKANKDTIIFNGVNYTQNKGASANFALSNGFHFNESASIDVYYFKVYDNADNLKYNCVPAIRLQDLKLGLYDLITERFFASNFTIAGPEVS